MTRYIAFVLVVLFLTGCAAPVRQVEGQYKRLDPSTEYLVEERSSGLLLSVVYRRYQFWPDESAVRHECRSTLTTLAHEQADQRGRRLLPVNQERIRLTTGRNIVSGTTFCSGTATVEYAPK